jgi:ABC-type lipoprotein release transport system permease subunit
MNIVGLVLRDLTRRPWRSGFTIAGVAAGACVYSLIIGSTENFVQKFHDLSSVLGDSLVVQRAGSLTPLASVLPNDLTERLRSLPGVAGVSRVGLGRCRVSDSPSFLVLGLDPLEPLAVRLPMARGRRLAAIGHGVLLGERAAARLGVGPGSELELGGQKLTVGGIFRTGHSLLDAGAAMDLAEAQRVFDLPGTVTLMLVDLESGIDPAQACAEVSRQFPSVEVTTLGDFMDTIATIRFVEQFARLLALLAVGIAALGAANVLSLSVQERTREIAVLRAIGWQRQRIAGLVLCEGLCVGLAGGVVAAPISLVALGLLARFGPGSSIGLLSGLLPPGVALEATAVSAAAAVLGAGFPVARALRITPSAALRAG